MKKETLEKIPIEKILYVLAAFAFVASCAYITMNKDATSDDASPVKLPESITDQTGEPETPEIPEPPEPEQPVESEPQEPEPQEPEQPEEPAEPAPVTDPQTLSDYETLCTTEPTMTATHIEQTVGRAFVDYWEFADGNKIGPSYKWLEHDKQNIRSFRCYNIDGEKDGPAVDWESDGTREFEYNYIDGELDGVYKEWEDGVLIEEKNYAAGLLHGALKRWSSESTPKVVENYMNGTKDGEWNIYHKNGQLKEEFSYDYGIRSPNFKFYYEDGSLQSERKGELKSGRFTGLTWNYGMSDSGRQEGTKCEFIDDEKISCEDVVR